MNIELNSDRKAQSLQKEMVFQTQLDSFAADPKDLVVAKISSVSECLRLLAFSAAKFAVCSASPCDSPGSALLPFCLRGWLGALFVLFPRLIP